MRESVIELPPWDALLNIFELALGIITKVKHCSGVGGTGALY